MAVEIGTIKRVAERKAGQGGVGRFAPQGGVYDILVGEGLMRGIESPDNFKLGDKVKVDKAKYKILGAA